MGCCAPRSPSGRLAHSPLCSASRRGLLTGADSSRPHLLLRMSNAPAPRPSTASALFAALGTAVGAFMVLALLTPRFSTEGDTNWLIAIGVAVVAAAAVYFFVARRGGGVEEHQAHPPR